MAPTLRICIQETHLAQIAPSPRGWAYPGQRSDIDLVHHHDNHALLGLTAQIVLHLGGLLGGGTAIAKKGVAKEKVDRRKGLDFYLY